MRRSLILLPLLALVAGGLTSCSEDQASAAELIRSAAATTSDGGSTTFTMTSSFEGPDGDTIEIVGDGGFDFGTQSGHLTMTVPPVPGLPDDLELELVFSGSEIFQRSELFGAIPGGAEWVRFDIAELTEAEAGVDITQLQSSNSDPTAGLAVLQAVAEDDIEELGDEEVAGVSTTHYRASIDIEAAYEEADAVTDRESFEAFLDTVGVDTLTIDVWIDDEGRVRRQSWHQPTPTTPGETTDAEITMEFTSFGEPVEIDIPDEEDTVDLMDLLPGD